MNGEAVHMVDMHAQEEALPAAEPEMSTARLSAAFALLGTDNNALYVVLLTAAQDLIQHEAPVGVVLLANILPALLAKLLWPYFSKGAVRYGKRVISCTAISSLAMLLVALIPSTPVRLFGIGCASFSSGLGEMTYLQLSTLYGPLGGQAVGWFSSGTGAAGFVGALWWWALRGLGIPVGLGLSALLPLGMSLAYFAILPTPEQLGVASTAYKSLPDDEDGEEVLQKTAPLTMAEKLELAKPLVLPYMLPLFVVYAAEYTINTGVAPTLLFPVPASWPSTLRGLLIHRLSDYYVLYQLTYQIFVFFARSSTVLCRFPPLPKRLIALPSLLQCALLGLTILESATSFLEHSFGDGASFWLVLLMIALEGSFGGLSYVSVFSRINAEGRDGDVRETEFKIASVGFADSSGIVLASLVSTVLQPALCGVQVGRGKTLCRDV